MQGEAEKMERWTTAQAAFILGEDPQKFTKVVDRTPVKPRVVRRGKTRVRYFDMADLVYIHALDELIKTYTTQSRSDLYTALKGASSRRRHEIKFGSHKYNFYKHLRSVQVQARKLERLSNQIDASGDEALIRGTSIEAQRIAALLDGGMTVSDILGDYPSLNQGRVLAAKAYAEANPKPGRPYPSRTAKAAMRKVDLSALDAFSDAHD